MGFSVPQTKQEIAKALQPLPQDHIRQRVEERSVELFIPQGGTQGSASTCASGALSRTGRRTGSFPCSVGQGKNRTDEGQVPLSRNRCHQETGEHVFSMVLVDLSTGLQAFVVVS